MSTIHSPNLTSYTFRRAAKPTSIGKLFTLAAAGAIGVGAVLGLAVFESSGTASAAPAAIVVPASSASLDAHAFGTVAPGFIAPTTGGFPTPVPLPPVPPGNPPGNPPVPHLDGISALIAVQQAQANQANEQTAAK